VSPHAKIAHPSSTHGERGLARGAAFSSSAIAGAVAMPSPLPLAGRKEVIA
jgi:hypothetical protein